MRQDGLRRGISTLAEAILPRRAQPAGAPIGQPEKADRL